MKLSASEIYDLVSTTESVAVFSSETVALSVRLEIQRSVPRLARGVGQGTSEIFWFSGLAMGLILRDSTLKIGPVFSCEMDSPVSYMTY